MLPTAVPSISSAPKPALDPARAKLRFAHILPQRHNADLCRKDFGSVVEEGRQIIGECSNIRYVQSDAREIDTILAVAELLFGEERRVAMSMVGLVCFIDDAVVASMFERLYDWSAPGSQLGVTTFVADEHDPNYRKLLTVYERTSVQVHQRVPGRPGPEGMPRLELLAEQHLGTRVALDEESGQPGYGGVLYRS